MFASRGNLIVITTLFLLGMSGCIGLTRIGQKDSESQGPIRKLRIQIDESRREELFDQLRKFADEHAFEFDLTFYDSDKKVFLVVLYRDDLKISAVDAPKAPAIIDLGVYERNPANATAVETVDELFTDLKRFIGEIPDVMITET